MGASFNYAFVQIIAIIFIGITSVLIVTVTHILAGVVFAVACGLLLITVISAARVVFITAVYKNITGGLSEQYDQHFIDHLFETK